MFCSTSTRINFYRAVADIGIRPLRVRTFYSTAKNYKQILSISRLDYAKLKLTSI